MGGRWNTILLFSETTKHGNDDSAIVSGSIGFLFSLSSILCFEKSNYIFRQGVDKYNLTKMKEQTND